MKKVNYSAIDDGFLFTVYNLEIKVIVEINQAWVLTIGDHSFKFKNSKEAASFLNLMKQFA